MAENQTPLNAEEAAAQQCIAAQVTAMVDELIGDDLPVAYGRFPTLAADAACVRAAPGDPVVRRYAAGGGIYRFAWEVYLRSIVRSDGESLDALNRLQALQGKLASTLPGGDTSWVGQEVTNLPALYDIDDDGNETCYLSAQTTYFVPSPRTLGLGA